MLKRIPESANNLIIPLFLCFKIIFMLYVLGSSYFELVWKDVLSFYSLMVSFVRASLRMEKLLSGRITWTWFRIAAVMLRLLLQ